MLRRGWTPDFGDLESCWRSQQEASLLERFLKGLLLGLVLPFVDHFWSYQVIPPLPRLRARRALSSSRQETASAIPLSLLARVQHWSEEYTAMSILPLATSMPTYAFLVSASSFFSALPCRMRAWLAQATVQALRRSRHDDPRCPTVFQDPGQIGLSCPSGHHLTP